MPGVTYVNFSIEGVRATTQTTVNISSEDGEEILEMPQASVASGSHVYKGSQVTLTTKENGLKIWYTTDGTCPCDVNGTRKLYLRPIVINEETTIKAMCEGEEGTSDIATFVYMILKSESGIQLDKGWNWVSFNMENAALSNVDAALKSGKWTSADEIKNAYYFDSYSKNNMQWMGTLSQHGGLNNKEMYKLYSSREQNVALSGDAVNPENTSIAVRPNWNYISYLPLTDLSVEEALSGYEAKVGDVIKSQDEFAVYTDKNKWEGSLKTLFVGQGYMLKRAAKASTTKFYYPATSMKNKKPATRSRSNKNYADNMNVIGVIEEHAINEGDSIVAVVQGEYRGACALMSGEKVFLTIQGDYAADVKLLLKRGNKIIARAENKITFASDSIIGTMDEPTKITFASMSEQDKISVTPHIVENELLIAVNDESMTKVEIFIYSTDGVIIRESKENAVTNGNYTERFMLSDVPTGVYLVKILINNESNIVRIIKK